ncbi:AMP-binding protein [Ancylobacter amanitiformis]|uniref:Long-chain acyl-CoA synthetase n=1 Tax=Ancylobacter amanitiformis TaxID=217069 RepID=A0ABU0LPJ2_9HYPH|nr:AMP-binding protein [Ancylobacter amanitiformis]MDQ0510573.1 long-chain acyl-CoA synthetase [Ancylobacter amanitiformis]
MAHRIGDRLDALALEAPERPALICGEEMLTRAAFAVRVARWRGRIASRVAPGADVALGMGNSPDLVAAFFACATGGRAALVYDPSWPATYRASIDAALGSPLALAEGDAADAAPVPAVEVSPDQPFYVGFTSGSTGVPKGYRRAHRSWIDSFAVSEEVFGLSGDDVILAPGGLSASLHLYGVVHALHIGATAVMLRQFLPLRALELIARHDVTALYATPTQLQMLTKVAAAEGLTCPTIRRILISGAKWRSETRAAVAAVFPHAGIAEFYGASEMSFITLVRPGETPPPGSVGRAAPGVALAIRDEAGRDLPAGETGAIWVASTMLFDAYACGGGAETRRAGAFLTIGDHGRLDAAGYLTLAGRERRMLVTAGMNVYPEEVEAVLAAAPGIEEAVVLGLPDPLRGVEMVAVLRGPGAAGEATLRAHARAHLPTAKLPRRFLALEDWPRTSGGKVDLPVLQRRVEALLAPAPMLQRS